MNHMGITDIEPVKRTSVTEMVTDSILSLIRKGALKPGDKLPSQKELETMLQVSRPSLREALNGLSALGYIETRPGQGYYVRAVEAGEVLDFSVLASLITEESIVQLFEARMYYEAYFTRLAALRATSEEIKALYEHTERLEAVVSATPAVTDTIELGMDFHQQVVDTIHNPVLSDIERSLLKLFTEKTLRIYANRPSHTLDMCYHRRIVDYIATRNPEAASAMAMKDISLYTKYLGIDLKVEDYIFKKKTF